MVGKPEILELNAQLDNFQTRIKFVTLHRDTALKKKIESHNRIVELITKIIKEPLSEDDINTYTSEIFSEMKNSDEGTYNEHISYEMLMGILDSPHHMPKILNYIEKIDPEGTDQYTQDVIKQMNNLKRIYDTLIEQDPLITKSLEKQAELCKEFENGGNLIKLVQYLQEFKKQQVIQQQILAKILPDARAVITGWERTKNIVVAALHKEEEFYEKHKIALAIGAIGIIGLGLVSSVVFPPVIAGEAAIAIGLLGRVRSIFSIGKAAEIGKIGIEAGKIALDIKEVSKSASEILLFELKK